jgi:hypothetical protein
MEKTGLAMAFARTGNRWPFDVDIIAPYPACYQGGREGRQSNGGQGRGSLEHWQGTCPSVRHGAGWGGGLGQGTATAFVARRHRVVRRACMRFTYQCAWAGRPGCRADGISKNRSQSMGQHEPELVGMDGFGWISGPHSRTLNARGHTATRFAREETQPESGDQGSGVRANDCER